MPWFSVDAFDVYSSVRRPNDARHQRQSRQEFLLHQRQSPDLSAADGGGWRGGGFESDRGRFFLYLNALPKNFLARQDKLKKWRFSFRNLDVLSNDRLVAERGAGQIVMAGRKTREFKAASVSRGSRPASGRQTGTDKRAGCPGYGSIVVSRHLTFQGVSLGQGNARTKRNFQKDCQRDDLNGMPVFIDLLHSFAFLQAPAAAVNLVLPRKSRHSRASGDDADFHFLGWAKGPR